MSQETNSRGETDLRDVALVMWAGKWWIAGAACLSAAILTLIAFMMTPIYRASTVLVPVRAESTDGGGLGAAVRSLSGAASLVGLSLGGGSSDLEESLAVLRSREFLDAFIRDENLMPVLFNKEWDEAGKAWKEPAKAPTPAQAHRYFTRQILSIAQDKKTGLITISIDFPDRERAAYWANELVRRINHEMRTRARQEAASSLGYLETELGKTSLVSVREAINNLIEAQIRKSMLANVSQEYVFRVVEAATPPDANDKLRPNRKLMLVAGGMAGALLAALTVLMVWRLRPPER
jgi:uncharacterized protein involved in exopolysaccharide biosynthesis